MEVSVEVVAGCETGDMLAYFFRTRRVSWRHGIVPNGRHRKLVVFFLSLGVHEGAGQLRRLC